MNVPVSTRALPLFARNRSSSAQRRFATPRGLRRGGYANAPVPPSPPGRHQTTDASGVRSGSCQPFKLNVPHGVSPALLVVGIGHRHPLSSTRWNQGNIASSQQLRPRRSDPSSASSGCESS